MVDDYNRFTVSPWTAVHVAGGIDGVEPLGKGLALSLTAAVENLLERRYAASGWINPDVNRAGEAIYLEPGDGTESRGHRRHSMGVLITRALHA